MAKNKFEWWVRPGWSGSASGAVAAATLGKYIVESDTESISMNFAGFGAGMSVGFKYAGSYATESMAASGSPLYEAPRLRQKWGRVNYRALSGLGAIVEGGAGVDLQPFLSGLAGGVQLLVFGLDLDAWLTAPVTLPVIMLEAARATNQKWPFDSLYADGFAIVGGVSEGVVAQAGWTAYAGWFL